MAYGNLVNFILDGQLGFSCQTLIVFVSFPDDYRNHTNFVLTDSFPMLFLCFHCLIVGLVALQVLINCYNHFLLAPKTPAASIICMQELQIIAETQLRLIAESSVGLDGTAVWVMLLLNKIKL